MDAALFLLDQVEHNDGRVKTLHKFIEMLSGNLGRGKRKGKGKGEGEKGREQEGESGKKRRKERRGSRREAGGTERSKQRKE